MDENARGHTTTHGGWPAAMTRTKAAEYIGVGPHFIDQLRRRGELDPVLIGGTVRGVRYLKVDLDEYLTSATRRSEIA